MNIDFINDLIDQLIETESSKRVGSSTNFAWSDDECIWDRGQDPSQSDAYPSVVYKLQRVPKLSDRRLYLIATSDADETEKYGRVGSECVCQQLPYSSCLNLVRERQQDLSWIGDTMRSDEDKSCTQTFSSFVRHACHRLLSCPLITIDPEGGWRSEYCGSSSSTRSDQTGSFHPNILNPDYVLETERWFYWVTRSTGTKDWMTLWDAATFTPHVLVDYADRLLFVIYQLLSTLVLCQKEAGFLLTDLRLDAIRVNAQDLWCRLDLWRCLQREAKNITLSEDCQQRWSLGAWCDRWASGALSNFDYLSILNEFAGRRLGDPYYHPIFPWVCDFTRDPLEDRDENGGWRDLTKTKFRLTKGDQQLDQTYAGHQVSNCGGVGPEGLSGRSPSISGHSPAAGRSLPPHHVTEFLSDIGYYAYKSRRTPKSVLCRHVRHRWVPEEYPASLARLYHWTPDESIPEFYSDPEIFASMHADLPDLELPSWIEAEGERNGGRKFIDWHRAMLESDHVSDRLHSWVDLVFGYQLTGHAAVRAKNVQLHLVENADRLNNSGVVQLFTKPHPRRNTKAKPISSASACVDDVMNPLYNMEHSQRISVQESTSNEPADLTSPSLPADTWREMRSCQVARKTCPLVRACLSNLAVLITELCHSEAFRQLPRYASSSQRIQVAKRVVFDGNNHSLPRCVRFAVELLLDPDLHSENLNSTPSVDPATLCPGLILQPLVSLIPFPYWVAPLYDCFRRIRSLELHHAVTVTMESDGLDSKLLLESAEKRVREVAKLLPLILPHTSMVGVEILARLTKRALLSDPCARVMAVWLLWNPLTQALGPELTEKHFMDCLINLYDADSPCSAKFLKLYHRTFLLQLSVRLGMKRFLEHFIQPLVEAAAGERDKWLVQEEDLYWKMVIGAKVCGDGDLGVDSGAGRQLIDFPLPSENAIDSPVVERESEIMDDSDLVEQFPLEITGDGCDQHSTMRNSASFDFDTPATDVTSIRSSESGISGGGSGTAFSFTASKTDADEEQERQSNRQHSNQPGPLVSEVAEESLLWLAHRLGPLLTARYVTSNLLRMLALCYGTDRLEPAPAPDPSWYPVTGDAGADKVLHCLEEIAMIYGEHMILRHYFAYAGELISQALRRLTPNMEMAVLACVALIRRTFPYLTDEQLMENLKDHTFIDTLLFPLIRAASSVKVTFSSASSRTTLTWKLAECLYWLGVRVGSENVKTHLFVLIQRFFCTYDILYQSPAIEDNVDVKEITVEEKSADWSDAAFVQLKATFTPVLAARMLEAFGELCGKQYLQLSLSNSDLLAKLCVRANTGMANSCSDAPDTEAGLTGQHRISGDNWKLGDESEGASNQMDSVCKRLKHSSRKLKGTWLAYWEHELGRNPKEMHFNFKHMKLQSFVGHSGPVRKISSLDNENSFFSAGHDKTVKLWSLRSTGDGGSRTSCQYSYKDHKRAVCDLAFIESLRLIASVDGSVHIWDPFMGVPIREFDMGDVNSDPLPPHQQAHMATIVQAIAAPSASVLVAGTFSSIKFLDVRQAKWAHEFTLAYQRSQPVCGPVRAVCVDPSGADRWVAVGHGLGHVSTLDLRTGRLLGQMKLCDTDILTMSSLGKDTFIVCPFDQQLHLMKARDCALQCRIPGTSDAVTFATPFHQELICATQSNRLRFYTSVNADSAFTHSKLRADVFAGAITSLHVLPLNRTLLLGSTTGNIELLC